MKTGDALRSGSFTLKKHRCSLHPAREAEELLSYAARKPREFLLAHPEKKMTAAAVRAFAHALHRRLRHEPVEYIVGQASFFGRTFKVTKDTLIPRPATELLIEALVEVTEMRRGGEAETFIDIGTGSGAIAVTLALEFPDATVVATDTSEKALRIARANAKVHGVSSRVRCIKTDLLPTRSLAHSRSRPLSLIANLPYIPSAAMKKLPPDVKKEPRLALDGGKDGLAYYRRLLAHLPSRPLSLFLEILPAQYAPLSALAKKTLPGCRTEKVRGPSGTAIGMRLEPQS